MPSNFFVNCSICDYENVASVSDKKIMTCRKCEAPIYAETRPLNSVDIANYQKLWKRWGNRYRENNPDSLQRQAGTTDKRHGGQSELIELRKKVNELQAEIETQRKEKKYLQDSHEIAVKKFKGRHLAELNHQQNVLQREVETWKFKYKKSLSLAINEDSSTAPSLRTSRNDQSFYFDEIGLVELYNRDWSRFVQFAMTVEPTKGSLEQYIQGQSDSVHLEAKDTGKYWAIPTNIQSNQNRPNYYLALRKDIRFNQQNFSIIGACFDLKGRSLDKQCFDITSLAIIKPMHGESVWELTRRGTVNFKSIN